MAPKIVKDQISLEELEKLAKEFYGNIDKN